MILIGVLASSALMIELCRSEYTVPVTPAPRGRLPVEQPVITILRGLPGSTVGAQ